MPRNMSFQLTIEQVKNRTKTVTRRLGWTFLRPSDELNAVNRTMGFKQGERPIQLARIRVKDVRRERLNAITQEEVWREGFDFTPSEFVEFFCRERRIFPTDLITRIEFEYV